MSHSHHQECSAMSAPHHACKPCIACHCLLLGTGVVLRPRRHHPGWRREITVKSAKALQPYPCLRVGLGKRNPWPAFRPKRRSLAPSPQAQRLFVPHLWHLANMCFPKAGLAHSATANLSTKKTPLRSRPLHNFFKIDSPCGATPTNQVMICCSSWNKLTNKNH